MNNNRSHNKCIVALLMSVCLSFTGCGSAAYVDGASSSSGSEDGGLPFALGSDGQKSGDDAGAQSTPASGDAAAEAEPDSG